MLLALLAVQMCIVPVQNCLQNQIKMLGDFPGSSTWQPWHTSGILFESVVYLVGVDLYSAFFVEEVVDEISNIVTVGARDILGNCVRPSVSHVRQKHVEHAQDCVADGGREKFVVVVDLSVMLPFVLPLCRCAEFRLIGAIILDAIEFFFARRARKGSKVLLVAWPAFW